jgi:hypothetical protein
VALDTLFDKPEFPEIALPVPDILDTLKYPILGFFPRTINEGVASI